MNSKTVLGKILTLLSLNENEINLTYAKLADGTIVESPTFDVGEPLEVVSEDGTKTPAPDGEHELSLRDESGNENLIKVVTKDGKIVERENVELADEKIDEIPQANPKDKANEVPDVPGQVKSGTLMAEETEEVETIPADDEKPMEEEEDDKPEIEIELGKKMEEMVYRIEEMEKKMAKMEEAMMPAPDEEVVEEAMEDEELPKLDGAPVEGASKFSSENTKNYGKKVKDAQSSFLSKLYK